MQDRFETERLAGGGRSREDEDARPDHRADAKAVRLHGPSAPELALRIFGGRDQSVDALRSEKAHLKRAAGERARLPFTLALDLAADLFFMEPRATPAARFALGGAPCARRAFSLCVRLCR